MSIAILVAMMIAFPLIVLTINFLQMRLLRKLRNHDRMLYRLCAVRDELAMMAVNGELEEESELFRCLYPLSSTIIHHHRKSGLCFRNLIRTFDAHLKSRKIGADDSDYSALASDVHEAPPRAQELVGEFCNTILMGYLLSYRIILLDRLLRKFRNIDWFTILQRITRGSSEKRVLSFLDTLYQAPSGHVTLHGRKVALHGNGG